MLLETQLGMAQEALDAKEKKLLEALFMVKRSRERQLEAEHTLRHFTKQQSRPSSLGTLPPPPPS